MKRLKSMRILSYTSLRTPWTPEAIRSALSGFRRLLRVSYELAMTNKGFSSSHAQSFGSLYIKIQNHNPDKPLSVDSGK